MINLTAQLIESAVGILYITILHTNVDLLVKWNSNTLDYLSWVIFIHVKSILTQK